MPGSASYDRSPWLDRFRTPRVRALADALKPADTALLERFRKHLLELAGVTEEPVWYGDSWHWTLEYRTRLSKEPLAVVIPSPEDLQVALPLDREFTDSLPQKRMKRAVRDGLDLAQEPFHTRWGVWSLNSQLMDDLHDLVELKLKHLAKRAG